MGIVVFPHWKGKIVSKETHGLTPYEARDALKTADTMERAGWKRAAPGRWFSVVNALFISFIVALFALPDTRIPVLGLPIAVRDMFIVFGGSAYGVFIWRYHSRLGAYARAFSSYKGAWLPTTSFMLGFVVLIVLSFIFNTFLNMAWVSILAAILAGCWTYAVFEWERQRILELTRTKSVEE